MSRTIKDLPYELWQKHVDYYNFVQIQKKYTNNASSIKSALKRVTRRKANSRLKKLGTDYSEDNSISCRKPNSDWEFY